MKLLICFLLAYSAYGQTLLSGVIGGNASLTQAATPTDSNSGGSCTGSSPSWACSGTTDVTLITATSSAVICFTTDGSTTPAATTAGTCSTGTTYSSPISVSSTTTIKALVTKAGSTNSGVLTTVYTITATNTYTVQTVTAAYSVGSGTSTTCTFSPAAAAGDLIVAFGTTSTTNATGPALSVSDDHTNSYSTAVNDTGNLGVYGNHKVFYSWGVASGTSVVTLASNQFTTLTGACALIHDSAGSYSADPLDTSTGVPQTSVLFTASNSYTLPSITPSQADGVLVAFVAEENDVVTGWTGTASPWVTGGSLTGSFPVFSQHLKNDSATAYALVITTTGSGSFKYHGSILSFKHP